MDIKRKYPQNVGKHYKNTKKLYTDGIVRRATQKKNVSLDGFACSAQRQSAQTILLKDLSPKRFAHNAQRYIQSQKQRQEICRMQYRARTQSRCSMDGVRFSGVSRVAHAQKKQHAKAQWYEHMHVRQRMQNTYDAFVAYRQSISTYLDTRFDFTVSPVRMWQLSLTGAMIFGMVAMSMIYRNLGQSAFAKEQAERALVAERQQQIVQNDEQQKNEDAHKKNDDENSASQADEDVEKNDKKQTVQQSVDSIVQKEESRDVQDKDAKKAVKQKEDVQKTVDSAISVQKEKSDTRQKEEEQQKDVVQDVAEPQTLEDVAYDVVEGYPIEKMLPYILEQDPEVAKYLIAIAKQESGWGKRVPVLNGQDCYNYWGYRGVRKLMGSGGHTCFNSRKDAVETVGKRLEELIYEYDRTTAERLIVWKCGRSCAGHSPEGVNRWIAVVDTYYDKLSQKK